MYGGPTVYAEILNGEKKFTLVEVLLRQNNSHHLTTQETQNEVRFSNSSKKQVFSIIKFKKAYDKKILDYYHT